MAGEQNLRDAIRGWRHGNLSGPDQEITVGVYEVVVLLHGRLQRCLICGESDGYHVIFIH